ncbi:thioredoxin family protein [Frigidibacter sp.]|uniref:thioredoxin family protein n=1 Tax=Frigidibacter sp. TaxID=2586418 RepID=UPI00273339FA|nr:thioredoxin family protein [Frigidibacter sp.]MDP3342507.1 thioredoxin family protein [Frigidibacter sp.]
MLRIPPRTFRPLRAALAAVALLAWAGPALADLQLYMFERPGCPYCLQWEREVGPAYPNTAEGQAAPLVHLDIRDPLPPDLTVVSQPQFTPTFVLAKNGQEVSRLEGYPGEAFFWGLLEQMIAEATAVEEGATE